MRAINNYSFEDCISYFLYTFANYFQTMKAFYAITLLIALAVATAYSQKADTIPHPSALTHDALYSMHLLVDQPPTTTELNRDSHHLFLDIDAAGFFYDAETKINQVRGYTVAGFRLAPALTYGINDKAQLRVGFNATAFAGLDSLYCLRPMFTLIYAPFSWLHLIAGTIYGSHSHLLSPAVYDPSRWIYHWQEDGLQIMTNTQFWSSDTWLDWHHYLTPWTADQERFTLGTKHCFQLLRYTKTTEEAESICTAQSGSDITPKHTQNNSFIIELPAHFIASHRGGEVKTIDTNTITTFNEQIGLRFKYIKSDDDRVRHALTLELPVYFYHLEDNTLDYGGKALYPTLSYEWRHWNREQRADFSIRSTAGFWHGDHYFSAFGGRQFWSFYQYSAMHIAGAHYGDLYQQKNLATFTLSVEHEYKGLNLGFQFDAIYDIETKNKDFLFGFYMRFKNHFLLR